MILLQFFEGAKIEYYLRINNLYRINRAIAFFLIFKNLDEKLWFDD